MGYFKSYSLITEDTKSNLNHINLIKNFTSTYPKRYPIYTKRIQNIDG